MASGISDDDNLMVYISLLALNYKFKTLENIMAEVEQQPDTPVTPPKKHRNTQECFIVTAVDAGVLVVPLWC